MHSLVILIYFLVMSLSLSVILWVGCVCSCDIFLLHSLVIVCLCVCLFVRSFVHSLARSLVRSFVRVGFCLFNVKANRISMFGNLYICFVVSQSLEHKTLISL